MISGCSRTGEFCISQGDGELRCVLHPDIGTIPFDDAQRESWMRRRHILLASAFLLAGVATSLGFFFKQHPDFYDQTRIPDGPQRSQQSRDLIDRYNGLIEPAEQQPTEWQEVFTTEQINSYFQQDYRSQLPKGFSDLRVMIEAGKLRVGCRYGSSLGGTILSIEVRMWLVEDQSNVIGIELRNLRAGALPVSRDIVLDHISQAAAKSNMAVSWHYVEDNPVAYLRIQADKEQPTIRIDRLELLPGHIVIAGRRITSGP